MSKTENYKAINRELWNNKVESHVNSDFYNMSAFLNGASSLNPIELDLFGDIKGKSVLHLQCHFGQDSISLSRMGAKVTGVDLSDKAIAKGKELAKELGTDTEFICSDIYNLPNVLDKTFDFVFTSYGTIGWLPDLNKWAAVISKFLKPKGQFVFVEFHPVVWMFDDDFTQIKYAYSQKEAIIEEEEGTYADRNADLKQEFVTWNHSLSDVVQNLINNSLTIKCFNEFDYSPYPCFNHVEEFEKGKYRIKPLGDKIPMVYAIKAQKNLI